MDSIFMLSLLRLQEIITQQCIQQKILGHAVQLTQRGIVYHISLIHIHINAPLHPPVAIQVVVMLQVGHLAMIVNGATGQTPVIQVVRAVIIQAEVVQME
jgi:hypothetical protein